jgi:hypothetical protein
MVDEEDRCRIEFVANPAPEPDEVALDNWNFGTSKKAEEVEEDPLGTEIFCSLPRT